MAKHGGFPGGMGMPGNMNNLMKQAQRMQRQMEESQKEFEEKQEELNGMEFRADAGGKAVSAVVTGARELKELTIDPEAVDPDDVEMLQDMIVAAVNEALKQAAKANDELTESMNKKMSGPLGMF